MRRHLAEHENIVRKSRSARSKEQDVEARTLVARWAEEEQRRKQIAVDADTREKERVVSTACIERIPPAPYSCSFDTI